MREAVQYLIETQDDDGSWYGRWGVNYIYGTWQVLRGLRAIGENMTQDWILRGRDWLESCQNDDGGWGETCATYENSVLKGKGESTASQTAWALMGICACGDLDRPSVQRGLRYLLVDTTARWRLGRAANYRDRFPAGLLSEVRHVPAKFPAARAGDLCQLSQRARALSEFLSLPGMSGASARKRGSMWRCPECGRQFANRNQSHACGRYTLASHFEGKPPASPRDFRQAAARRPEKRAGHRAPGEDQDRVSSRMSFAAFVIRRNWVDGHVVLARRLENPRFRRIETFSPRNHLHAFRFESVDEIDDEVAAWFAEAYRVGEQRHLV